MSGNYLVFVHYFSDHGTGQATSGTVAVTLYETDPTKLKTLTKAWRTALSGAQGQTCCNQAPLSTGPDWVNNGAPLFTVDVVRDTIQ
jgi:hypothetical protein